jgi:hypothetical protein
MCSHALIAKRRNAEARIVVDGARAWAGLDGDEYLLRLVDIADAAELASRAPADEGLRWLEELADRFAAHDPALSANAVGDEALTDCLNALYLAQARAGDRDGALATLQRIGKIPGQRCKAGRGRPS